MKRIALIVGPCFVMACGQEATSPSNNSEIGTSPSALTASLHVSLGSDEVPSVKITAQGKKQKLDKAMVRIDDVSAHVSGTGWVRVLKKDAVVDVDVLDLTSHVADLGFAEIPSGKVTQVRLHVASDSSPYVVTEAGEEEALKVPSGMQSGIKIKGPWDIGPCASATVAFELAGKNAIQIHKTGHEDLWILRPVIRTKKVSVSGTCEDGSEEGTDPSDGGTTDGSSNPDPGQVGSGDDGSDDNSGNPDEGSNGGGSTDDGSNGGGSTDDGSSGGGSTDDGSSGGGSTDDGSSGGGSTTPPPCELSSECDMYSYCTQEGVCEPLPDM